MCVHPMGLLDFWKNFSPVIPHLFEQNGTLVITEFDEDSEIKKLLLLLKLLIPKNYLSRDMIPVTKKLVQSIKVLRLCHLN